MGNVRRIVKVNAISQAHLIKLMIEGVYTIRELAEETGLHYVTVTQYTRELHRAKAAHIVRWDKDSRGRDAIRIYKIGPGRDVKRSSMTSSERQAISRARRKMARMLGVLSANP